VQGHPAGLRNVSQCQGAVLQYNRTNLLRNSCLVIRFKMLQVTYKYKITYYVVIEKKLFKLFFFVYLTNNATNTTSCLKCYENRN